MWGAVLIASSLNNVGAGEQCFQSHENSEGVFDLKPFERIEAQVTVTFPLGSAVPLTWRVYSTLDDYPGAERWDTAPLLTGTIAPADPGEGMIRIEGVSRFRVCVTGDPGDGLLDPLVDLEYRRATPGGR